MNVWLRELFRDDPMKVEIYQKPVAVSYDPADEALPEALRNAKRIREYILAQPYFVGDGALFCGQIRFDWNIPVPADLFSRYGHKHFWKTFNEYYNTPQEDLFTFEWQHSSPDYDKIIRVGLCGVLDEIHASKARFSDEPEKVTYLTALEQVCHTMIDRAEGYAAYLSGPAAVADGKRKEELIRMAAALRHVPAHPADSFYEAVFTIYFCFDYLPDSVGTIDRYLWPFYQRDLAAGRLTRCEAKEMLQELFLHLNCHTPVGDERRSRGGECHFAIGGYLPDHTDGFTDLSRLIVEALMELPLHIPEISLRWTNKTPRDVLRFMMDCERHDLNKRIALCNDEPRIKGFMENLGMTFEQAVRYTMVGCNEPAFPGVLWVGGLTASVVHPLVTLLNEDRQAVLTCRDFEAFYERFTRHLERDIDRLIQADNDFNTERAKDINVLSAVLMDGPSQTGLQPQDGGLHTHLGGMNFMGLTSLIDSLTVIKEYVYDQKRFTMKALLENLDSNWTADPSMRTYLLKKAPYFGNNEDVSDRMAVRVTNSLWELTKDKRLMNGEHILFGTLAGYNPHHVVYGGLTPATPDGRMAGEPFMVGVGQSFGRDRSGMTALLSSVAGMQPSGIMCGPLVCNVNMDEKLIRDDAYFEKTVDEVETYFRLGGMHLQLNYVSRETLLAAKECPVRYRGMKVRISGWSGNFTELDERLQDDVIARTVQKA